MRCDKDVGKMCEGEGLGNGGRGCLGLEVQRVATTQTMMPCGLVVTCKA